MEAASRPAANSLAYQASCCGNYDGKNKSQGRKQLKKFNTCNSILEMYSISYN